jgi:hypothetical protein
MGSHAGLEAVLVSAAPRKDRPTPRAPQNWGRPPLAEPPPAHGRLWGTILWRTVPVSVAAVVIISASIEPWSPAGIGCFAGAFVVFAVLARRFGWTR